MQREKLALGIGYARVTCQWIVTTFRMKASFS